MVEVETPLDLRDLTLYLRDFSHQLTVAQGLWPTVTPSVMLANLINMLETLGELLLKPDSRRRQALLLALLFAKQVDLI